MPDIFTEWAERSRSAMDSMIGKMHEQTAAAAQMVAAYSNVAQAAKGAESAMRSATQANIEFMGGKTGGSTDTGGMRSASTDGTGDAGDPGSTRSALAGVTVLLQRGLGR